jgi:hypothetical protein
LIAKIFHKEKFLVTPRAVFSPNFPHSAITNSNNPPLLTSHLTWWRENYGSKTLFEITPSLLSDAKEQLLEGMTPRKKKRTNATVNRYFSSLSKAFSLATREWQLIPENPFTRISKLREDNSRNRFSTREELQALRAL